MSVFMDHNYSAGCRWSAMLQTKEKTKQELSFGFALGAQVMTATEVRMDHCYSRAIAESENESEDWNKIYIKEEPREDDEGSELSKAESGQLQVKEEPDQVSPHGFDVAQLSSATDVWLDHCYTRATAETANETLDYNGICVKEEPMDADENDCHNENAAVSATHNLNFAFAICEPAEAPSLVLQVLVEHSYASPPVKEEEPEQCPESSETDPLSLDQESNTEGWRVNGEEPLGDSREHLSAIDDREANLWHVITRDIDERDDVNSNQHDGLFQVNTDNLPIFQCRLCPESFESYPDFDCHFVISHSKNSNGCNFSCHFCAATFVSCQRLVAHMNSRHGCHIKLSELFNKPTASIPTPSESSLKEQNLPLRCRACLDLFSCETDLKIHLMLNKCELACMECESGFSSSDSLLEHRKIFHSDLYRKYMKRRYNCTLCKVAFLGPGDLLRHLMQRRCEEKFACKFCKARFLTADHLEAHTNPLSCHLFDKGLNEPTSELEASSNLANEVLHCHLCGEVFSYDTDLIRHFATNHINFVADDFHHRYINNTNRADGFDVHNEIKKSQPDETPASRMKHHTDSTLLHSLEVDTYVPKEVFSCHLCEKTFQSKYILNYHQETHKSRLDLDCVECERCFTLTSNLKKHLKRCPVSPVQKGRLPAVKEKKVKPKQALQLPASAPFKTHGRYRLTSQNFTCDMCQKTVPTKRELQYHLKSHVIERNFGCLECKKYFTHIIDFMEHTRHCSEKFLKHNKKSFKLTHVVRKRRCRAKKKKGKKTVSSC